ncbi:hypothetical protein DPMN_185062 [Dreissena polymorpha]|uniref:Uncharacterized protein n=1 Tax=Dreissena polymorpha TaxID=45954 RepID=A0A9D4I6Y7_DREPO|nr:hypothetical protein DPMN_185062 [Dreissena polymorpha]
MSLVAKNCPPLYTRRSTGGQNLSIMDKICPPMERFCPLVDKTVHDGGQKPSTNAVPLV